MITTAEMKKLEDLSEKHGITKLKLMENAGYGLFQKIRKYDKILIICGSGNNGGDGLVLARYLLAANKDVKVLFLGKESKLKREADFNYKLLKTINKDVFTTDKNLNKYKVLVDAMLGTGVKGKIREPYSSMIDSINKAKKTVIAVDIPTGLNPDTGEILDKIVKADLIYTFHDIKPGLEKYKDKVEIIDIGIQDETLDAS